MTTVKIPEKDQIVSPSIMSDCENAYRLIKAGKEKQAEELFPCGYYLVQKYLYLDIKDLLDQLRNRLSV